MNDYDIRIGALEAEITALKDRLAHYESEHVHSLHHPTRHEADEDAAVGIRVLDTRIRGLAERIAAMGGDGETLEVLLSAFAKDTVQFVHRAPDHHELRIKQWTADHVARLAAASSV